MTVRRRLDAELVRRGLARSRDHACELIDAGRVRVGGRAATKPATQVETAAPVVVSEAGDDGSWVSRGAHKLDGALRRFADAGRVPAVAGRRCLDAGASTGGFTQVLVRRGAAHVVAVDVGYGQLAWALRTDPRVTVIERTNVRDLDVATIGGPVDLVVGDLSFISLRLVLPALAGVTGTGADLVLLVKPQFEAGRAAVGPRGVVTDADVRRDTVTAVVERAHEIGLGLQAVTASPLPGPSGNVEYMIWLRGEPAAPAWQDLVTAAVAAGPQGPVS